MDNMVEYKQYTEICMRQKILLSIMLLICGSSGLYAGTMGAVAKEKEYKPFIIGEAAYSWPDVTGFDVNFTNLARLRSNILINGWGGRIAAGVMRSISDRFALSFEGGLMYNDHFNVQPVYSVTGAQVIPEKTTVTMNGDQYGFDLLGGIVYSKPKYDLFFKAGALFENTRTHLAVNLHEILRNNDRRRYFREGSTQAINVNIGQVMPEIKLGGGYHVTDNWSVTAAWMHAFGGTMGFHADDMDLQTNQLSIGNIAANLNNPSINSVLFGVQYFFS